MKYAFSLMALLVCALLFTGCDRSQLTAEKPDDEQEVSLELSTEQPQEDTTHSPDETLTLLRPDDETEAETTEPSSEENTEKQPPDKDETPADETKPATEQTVETPTTSAPIVGSETLPFSSELMTRPTDELTDNPQKLDTRLYAVFQNVMEQNFSRKEGKLFVYRLNGDGTEGAYELSFDINNAYDEKGLLNKNAAVTAEMKSGETLESGFNYGQGNRETYTTYAQYAETLNWLRTPLLTDGFALKNFSDLKLTSEDAHYLIKATYLPAALEKLYDMEEVVGTVTAYLQIDADGNVETLGWEQIEMIDDYPTKVACSEYTFQ